MRWFFTYLVSFGLLTTATAFASSAKPCQSFLTDLVFALNEHPPHGNHWPLALGRVIKKAEPLGGRDASVFLVGGSEGRRLRYVLRIHDGVPWSEGPNADAHRKAFQRESETLAVLNHGNIVRLLFASPRGVEPAFQVVEYLPKGTWDTLIEAEHGGRKAGEQTIISRGYLNLTLAAASDVLSALIEIHQMGIIHRDIKPKNIGFADAARLFASPAKLFDFTNAWHPGDAKPDYIVGSRGYIAPETWDFSPPTVAVDIYSLGTTIGEALVNFSDDWSGPSVTSPYDPGLRARVYNGRMAQLRQVRITNWDGGLVPLPFELLEVLSQALQPDPAKRIQSAQEMSDRIASIRTALSRDDGRRAPIPRFVHRASRNP